MEEIRSFEMGRLKHVGRIVADIYSSLVNEVIAVIKALPDNCRQSGENSKLKDVWEEFKYEFQGEQSILFGAYEHTIGGICASHVTNVDSDLKQLLWFWSKGYDEWDGDHDEDDKDLSDAFVDDNVAQELYDRVCQVANNEPLEVDPNEARDRDRYEEDMRPYRDAS
jgi:hypothetical protein